MKKILSFFAMLMAVISLQAQVTKVGDTFTEPGAGDQNNYAYTYRVTALPTSSADGKVEIVSFTRSGSSASSTQIAFGAVKETYSGSQKVFVVTKIGDSAFKGNAAMENFVLVYQLAAVPDVIEIGASAFQGCSKLKSIRVGSGAWSSGQWSSYSYAKFGKIGDQAFYNCTALNMTISCGKEVKNSGTNVTYSIGANAFYNCSKITQLTCGGSSIDKTAFTGCTGVVLLVWLGGTSTITSETNSPFYPMRTNTMWIGIYGSVPAYYFRNFTGISYINMPEDIWSYASVYNTSIGAYAFAGCTGMIIANVGGKVDGNAFYNCTGLTSVTWRGGDPGITAPNMSIFRSSSDKITSFSFQSTSGSCSVPDYICCGLTKIKSVTIPANTGGNIGKCAFQECSALETVDFSGDFSGYYSEIGNYAFYKCSALKTITTNKTEGLPEKVYKIGNNAFASCTVLTTGLSAKNTNISEIGSNAYVSSGIETLVIPASTWTLKMGKEIAGGYNSKLTAIHYLYTGNLTRANAGGSYANLFMSANSSYQSYRTKVTKVRVNNAATAIPDSLFYNFKGLETVADQTGALTVKGIKKVGTASFYGCSALTTVIFTELTEVGESAFESSGLNGNLGGNGWDKLETIGEKAFKDTKLAKIGSSITSLGALKNIKSNAFENCKSLTEVLIQENVANIYSDVFKGCSKLISINWRAKTYAYSDPFGETITKQVTKFGLGDAVEKIPSKLLVGAKIGVLEIPTSVTSIGSNAFKDATIDSIAFVCYNAATQSATVKTADDGPFAGAAIKVLFMPPSIKTVPQYMFAKVKSLSKFTYKGLETFDKYCFSGAGLTEITFNNIKNINAYAFENCTSLATINITGTVCTPASTAFSGTNVKNIVATCANYSDVSSNATWKAVCSTIKNADSAYDQDYLDGLLDDGFWMTNGSIDVTKAIDCEGHVTLKAVPAEGCKFVYWDDGNTENPREFDLSTWTFWRIGGICASESDWHLQHFSIEPAEAGNLLAYNEYQHDRSDLKYLNNEEAVLKAEITNDWYEFKEWSYNGTSSSITIGNPYNWDYEQTDMCHFYIRYMPGDDMGGGMGGGMSGYQKITSAQTDWSGQYYIAYLDDNDMMNAKVFDGSLSSLDAASNYYTVSLSGEYIYDETNSYFTIEKCGDGYAVKSQSGKYIDNATTGNALKESDTAKELTISYVDGAVEIVTSSNAHLRFNSTSGQERFRFFKESSYSGQKPIQLFKYQGGSGEGPSVSGEIAEHDEYAKAVCQLKPVDVNVVVSISGGAGDVEISGGITQKLGKKFTATATPKEGYIFKEWGNKAATATTEFTIDAKSVMKQTMMGMDPETGEMTFNTEPIWDGSGLIPFDPSGEYIYEIQAIFQVDPNYKKTYTITALSQDDSKGTVTGGGTYEEGSQATLTATGKTGYSFSVWDDGETANPRVITVTKDATYTAIFSEYVEKPKYTITVVSADEAQGTVTGGGEFDEYSTITIQATPKDGYDFDKWQDGNTENPRKVTVTENMTFTAYFKAQSGPAKQFTITVVSSNPSAGSVLGGGTYDEGSTIQIAAVPNEGYVFTMWNDENKDNPRNITVTADAIYVANFGPATGLENISLETEGTRKVMVEGNIYIIKDGKMYNILGTRVK